MSERDVTIRISATDNFSSTMQRYNASMGSAEQTTARAASNMGTANSRTGELGNTIRGLFTVALAQQIASFGVELYNIGAQANAIERVFNAMVGADQAAEVMERLRDATMGVVSDTELQTGANLLLRMGIAESPDELERIIGMIIRLKKPTEDAGSAIENFSLMMANQSVLRLDSFGLSSGRVRARILELLRTGQALNREEAFKMAVFEEGAKSMERLGSATTVASSSIARLGVTLTNIKDDFGQRLATGVEGTAGLIEIALGVHPDQVAQAERQAQAMADNVQQVMDAFKEENIMAGLPDDFIAEWIKKSLELAAQGTNDMSMDDIRRHIMATLQIPPEGFDMPVNFDLSEQSWRDVLDNATIYAQELAQDAKAARELQKVEEERAAVAIKAQEDMAAAHALFRDEIYRTAELTERAGIVESFTELSNLPLFKSDYQVPEFISQEQAEYFADVAKKARDTADDMERMNRSNNDVFTEEQVDRAGELASQAEKLADQAQKSAEAFANISLSELFGQTSGGSLADMFDIVSSQLEALGGTAEQVAALQDSMALASGEETMSSQFFENTLAPIIAQAALDAGPEMATALAQSLDQTLKDALIAGVDINSSEFLAALQEQVAASAEMGTFDPSAFLETFTNAQEPVTNMAEQGSIFRDVMHEAAEVVDTIGERLSTLTGKKFEIKAVLNIANSDQFTQMVRDMITQIVGNSGGNVPGSTPAAANLGS